MIHWVAFAAKNSNMFSQTNSLWLVRQCTQPLSAAFKRSNTHSEINITSLAQLVEHSSTNREVASSILAWSKKLLTFTLGAFSLWFVFVIVPGRKSTHLHKDNIQFFTLRDKFLSVYPFHIVCVLNFFIKKEKISALGWKVKKIIATG